MAGHFEWWHPSCIIETQSAEFPGVAVPRGGTLMGNNGVRKKGPRWAPFFFVLSSLALRRQIRPAIDPA